MRRRSSFSDLISLFTVNLRKVPRMEFQLFGWLNTPLIRIYSLKTVPILSLLSIVPAPCQGSSALTSAFFSVEKKTAVKTFCVSGFDAGQKQLLQQN